MLDRRADFPLADLKWREEVFAIDLFDERFTRDGKVPALMGFKESQNDGFQIVQFHVSYALCALRAFGKSRISQLLERDLNLDLLHLKTWIAIPVRLGLVFKRLFLAENPVANMMVRTTDAYHFLPLGGPSK